MTLVHNTVCLVEVSAEAADMSCKLFLSCQHKSVCVRWWGVNISCCMQVLLLPQSVCACVGVCARTYMVDPVAW